MASLDIIDLVTDSYMQITKQILKRQEKYLIIKNPRIKIYIQSKKKSLEIIQKQKREIIIINEELIKDAITIQFTAPVKIAKKKTLKIILKKMLAKKIDLKSLIK